MWFPSVAVGLGFRWPFTGRVSRAMIVGIDASNIRAGGGVTHLREMLAAAESETCGFRSVHVWAGTATARCLEARPWLVVHTPKALDGNLLQRVGWTRLRLDAALAEVQCDRLLVPGGSYDGEFRPFVALAQNLLPFLRSEWCREGWSAKRLRLMLLGRMQTLTFARADGVIFMSRASREVIEAAMSRKVTKSAVIYHGVHPRFLRAPRRARLLTECSPAKPFRWLYVSIVEPYKLQWNVAAAAGAVLQQGIDMRLDLIGPGDHGDVRRLRREMRSADPSGERIHYHGQVPYEDLDRYYAEADAFVFASTCETFGMILTEAMASGLPLAASNRTAIPEVAGDAALYFNPEDPVEIASIMQRMMEDSELRTEMAKKAFERAKSFSWESCARETFQFLHEIVYIQSSTASEHASTSAP